MCPVAHKATHCEKLCWKFSGSFCWIKTTRLAAQTLDVMILQSVKSSHTTVWAFVLGIWNLALIWMKDLGLNGSTPGIWTCSELHLPFRLKIHVSSAPLWHYLALKMHIPASPLWTSNTLRNQRKCATAVWLTVTVSLEFFCLWHLGFFFFFSCCPFHHASQTLLITPPCLSKAGRGQNPECETLLH